MLENGKIMEELNQKFLVVSIDFYEDGHINHFVFLREEISEEKVVELYETYTKLYHDEVFTATFEDYLKEKEVNYDRLTFVKIR